MTSETQTKATEPAQVEALIREIERYLAAVQAFRAEGCEPRWRADRRRRR